MGTAVSTHDADATRSTRFGRLREAAKDQAWEESVNRDGPKIYQMTVYRAKKLLRRAISQLEGDEECG